MPLDIVRGRISNIVATKELIEIVEQQGNHEYSILAMLHCLCLF